MQGIDVIGLVSNIATFKKLHAVEQTGQRVRRQRHPRALHLVISPETAELYVNGRTAAPCGRAGQRQKRPQRCVQRRNTPVVLIGSIETVRHVDQYLDQQPRIAVHTRRQGFEPLALGRNDRRLRLLLLA